MHQDTKSARLIVVCKRTLILRRNASKTSLRSSRVSGLRADSRKGLRADSRKGLRADLRKGLRADLRKGLRADSGGKRFARRLRREKVCAQTRIARKEVALCGRQKLII